MLTAMPGDAHTLLPLKPLVYEILLALSDGKRHGWSVVREIQERNGGHRVLPANFYRTLRGMLADGLIAEASAQVAPATKDKDDERRRYFQLSPLGRDAARLEARRLKELVSDARTRRLLKQP
jgi:DNA-binding PadR family transcriptional regulator